MTTLVLNYSHPLAQANLYQLFSLTKDESLRVLNIPVQIDQDASLWPQVSPLVEAAVAEIKPDERVVVILPGLSSVAALLWPLLSERLGYWPPFVKMAPRRDSLRPEFGCRELIMFEPGFAA